MTNLCTIVPLRAANARTLIEQSIGRGLRLPYGIRTGVSVVDRLSIVAHDRFQEIIDEANRPDSVIRLTQVILDPSTDLQKTTTVEIRSNLVEQIDAMADESERRIAQATCEVIRRYENLPGSNHLLKPDIQEQIVQEVTEYVRSTQQALPGVTEQPDVAAFVHAQMQAHQWEK